MWAKRVWLFFRYTRWILWLGFLGLSAEFVIHRPQNLDSFGHLLPTTELLMFALPVTAVFIGCLELMLREKAGISRSGHKSGSTASKG